MPFTESLHLPNIYSSVTFSALDIVLVVFPTSVALCESSVKETSTCLTAAFRPCFVPPTWTVSYFISVFTFSGPSRVSRPLCEHHWRLVKSDGLRRGPFPPTCLHRHNGHFTARLGVMEPGWACKDGSPPDGNEVGDVEGLMWPRGTFTRPGDQPLMPKSSPLLTAYCRSVSGVCVDWIKRNRPCLSALFWKYSMFIFPFFANIDVFRDLD